MADETAEFRDAIRQDIIDAFGPAGEEAAADEQYAEAVRKRDKLEADYAAAVNVRMTEVAGVLNERFSAILPAGVRFEWPEGQEGDHP